MKKNKMTHEKWIKTILASYVGKHSPDEAEVHHLKDFLAANPNFKVSTRVSYMAVREKAEKWVKKLNDKNKSLKESGRVEIAFDFKNGIKLVRLANQTAKNWEGKHMGHCVASYSNHEGIYSLRDEFNIPYCTIEVSRGTVVQIKGRANKEVALRYHHLVIKSLSVLECKLSAMDLKNIGYHAVSKEIYDKFQEHFSGVMNVIIEGRYYINISSPLKLKKEFTQFDADFCSALIDKFNCPEAVKQLISLKFIDVELRDQYIAAEIKMSINKIHIVKPLVELISSPQKVFLQNLELLSVACSKKEITVFKYLFTKYESVLKNNWVWKSVLPEILKNCLAVTSAARNLEMTLFVFSLGAVPSVAKIQDWYAWATDEKSEKLWEILKPFNVNLNNSDFDALIERAISQRQAMSFDTLIRMREFNPSLINRLLRVMFIPEFSALNLLKEKANEQGVLDNIFNEIISGNVSSPALIFNKLKDENFNLLTEDFFKKAIVAKHKEIIDVFFAEGFMDESFDFKIITAQEIATLASLYPKLSVMNKQKLKNKAFTLKLTEVLEQISIMDTPAATPKQTRVNVDDLPWDDEGYYDVMEMDGRVRREYDPRYYQAKLDQIRAQIAAARQGGFRVSPHLIAQQREIVSILQRLRQFYGSDEEF